MINKQWFIERLADRQQSDGGHRVGILRRGLTTGKYTISTGADELHDQSAKSAAR